MNLLPLCLAFIMIFYYFCASSWKDLRTTLETGQASRHFFEAQRHLYNKKQKGFYKNYNDENKQEEKKEKKIRIGLSKKIERVEPFISHREKTPPRYETAKLHLHWLVSKQSNDALVILLDKIALTLIRNLYQETTIYTEGLENRILAFIKDTAKEHSEITTLEDLFACYAGNDPELYKVFKGTAEYDLTEKKGYPSLLDYLSLKKGSAPIQFYNANAQVLSAAFGKTIFEKIIDQEKQKWESEGKKSLTDGELKLLLSQFIDMDALQILQLIEFSPSIRDSAPSKEAELKP